MRTHFRSSLQSHPFWVTLYLTISDVFKYNLILSSSNTIEMTFKFEETEKLSIFYKKKKVFLILKSAKPDGVNLLYFKHRFFDLTGFIV